jgi:DNA-binding transcriptional LysR family regulator
MVPNFSLRQLSYLVAVADLGSMTAAADAGHVSQAAISVGIHDLERRLGVQLLARRPGHGVAMTEAGVAVVAKARRVLAASAELQSSARAPDAELHGTLTLGCFTTLAPLWLPPLHATFAMRHPTVELSVVEGSQEELRRALSNGTCELAVSYHHGLEKEFATKTIRTLRPYALVSADHRLAGEVSVTPQDLADEPLIEYSLEPTRGSTADWIRTMGGTPRIVHTSANVEVVRCLVARGLGWTPQYQRWPMNVSLEGLPLAAVPIAGEVVVNRIVAAWPRQDHLSRRAAAVVSFLNEVARRMPGPDAAEPAG